MALRTINQSLLVFACWITNGASGVVEPCDLPASRFRTEPSQFWFVEDDDHQLERGWLRFPPGFMTLAPCIVRPWLFKL